MHPFGFQIWCYLAIVVAGHAYYAFVRTKAQELEQSELRQALASSELQMLRSQLNYSRTIFSTRCME